MKVILLRLLNKLSSVSVQSGDTGLGTLQNDDLQHDDLLIKT